MRSIRPQPWLLAGVGAILLSLSYAPVGQAWLGWIGLIPFALAFILEKQPLRKALGLGYFFGLIHFGVTLWWVHEVSYAGWIALTMIMSCYPAIWAVGWSVVAKPGRREMTSWYNISRGTTGAALWVVLEWLRGWLFTGFPWNFLGVSQAEMAAIIQIAEWGGVLLVSFLVAMVNLILALSLVRIWRELQLKQKSKPHFDFSIAMLLVALAFVYGIRVLMAQTPPEENPRRLSFLAVQPNIPQDPWGEVLEKSEVVDRMINLSETGGLEGTNKPDIVIWPETPVGGELIEHPALMGFAQSLVYDIRSPFLLGSVYYEGGQVYNAALMYQVGESFPQIYKKQHLVIMGEYVPLANFLPFLRRFVPLGVDYSPGTESVPFHLTGPDLKLAPLICFEDVVPSVAASFIQGDDADLFVNMTNDGWFRRSAQSRQHVNNARFRCVEFRRPMIRVCNNGVTCAIDETGVMRSILQDPETGSVFETGVLRSEIRIPGRKTTLYARAGNWIVWVSMVICALSFVQARLNRG